MKCPWCHARESRVMDSRYREDGTVIRRRRMCTVCKRRFTTYEKVGGIFPWIVKKDNRRENYSPEKLLSGIWKACEKLPISREQMDEVVSKIEIHLCDMGEKEVPVSVVGDQVMKHLRNLHQVAYVRFASVYRTFNDLDDFMDELKDLLKKEKPVKGKAKAKAKAPKKAKAKTKAKSKKKT